MPIFPYATRPVITRVHEAAWAMGLFPHSWIMTTLQCCHSDPLSWKFSPSSLLGKGNEHAYTCPGELNDF